MPSTNYLVIPQVSSENRQFIPIGYESPETLASNLVCIMPNAGLYEFGMLSSTMHNAWMRAVGGRLESRYRYSIRIVYNNFPWPTPSDKQRVAIEKAAQAVLDARAAHPKSNLAALYDPVTMPPNLVAAHRQLDRAVDSAYGFRGELESARVALLFALYEQLTSLLPPSQKQKRRKRAAGA